ncbi:hypothetical protein GGR51DRAFT_569815 [Nemania sp. FL0031]|nr:hypothetical protein GGR51DRAFT_569815 [Nemania sp. FL0031]
MSNRPSNRSTGFRGRRGTPRRSGRVHNTPAGPGNQMSNDEVQASQPGGATVEPPDDWEMIEGAAEFDVNVGDDEYSLLDLDNPPVRPGGNATTVGFELEILVAIARGTENLPDPHPNDTRWLSDDIFQFEVDDGPLKYTVRNKIIDELIRAGVVANKIDEGWSGNLAWWDSFEYEKPNQNDDYIRNWKGGYTWDPKISERRNIVSAVNTLKDQFLRYHRDHNLEVYMTREDVLKEARDRVTSMITGPHTRRAPAKIRALWYEQVNAHRYSEKEKHYSSSANLSDPNTPAMRFIDTYKAWSCTDDATIMDYLPLAQHYEIPPSGLPIDPARPCFRVQPSHAYKWFGAEIRSSVLDYDGPETHITLRKVCESLRNALRIHKPLARVLSGLHVHIGQQAGWTLLHLKKFATLWHLLEPSLYKLHRRDRSESIWCEPMSTKCELAANVFSANRTDAATQRYVERKIGTIKKVYTSQMNKYIPAIRIPRLNQFFFTIWQFETINELNYLMRNNDLWSGSELSLRWRCAGEQLSSENATSLLTQTIEFRMMQGTMDADHIWRWAGIVERIVIFTRDSTPEVYRAAIQSLLDKNLPDSLGFNQEDLAWFAERQTDDGYFSYPDNDRVDWADPFMTRGHGDTHQ